MHIYILGICGTFMGSLAILAREAGIEVSGCDANVYPPMSTQLEEAGIKLDQGFEPSFIGDDVDLVVVGNAMSRGNLMVEHVLNKGLKYTSGPAFLHDHIFQDKWVLAVAGTHGKTTTSSMLAYILEYAGMKPGFLIGGVLKDFPFSARLGDGVFFVVEADEYDTAFFDKRSKFVHYLPKTLVLNNLEFDHADIFEDLDAIKKQFHHVVRIVPEIGRVVVNGDDANLADVMSKGLWSEQASFSTRGEANAQSRFHAKPVQADCSEFEVSAHSLLEPKKLRWGMTGEHNMANAIAAIAAAEHVGVKPETSIDALCEFSGVKRRMELLATIDGVRIYDDFAHHPTAIKTTLSGAKANQTSGRLIAVVEPRSNTMKMGVHQAKLLNSVEDADACYWYMGDQDWQLPEDEAVADAHKIAVNDLDSLIENLVTTLAPNDTVVVMSNGGFASFHQRLITALKEKDCVNG